MVCASTVLISVLLSGCGPDPTTTTTAPIYEIPDSDSGSHSVLFLREKVEPVELMDFGFLNLIDKWTSHNERRWQLNMLNVNLAKDCKDAPARMKCVTEHFARAAFNIAHVVHKSVQSSGSQARTFFRWLTESGAGRNLQQALQEFVHQAEDLAIKAEEEFEDGAVATFLQDQCGRVLKFGKKIMKDLADVQTSSNSDANSQHFGHRLHDSFKNIDDALEGILEVIGESSKPSEQFSNPILTMLWANPTANANMNDIALRKLKDVNNAMHDFIKTFWALECHHSSRPVAECIAQQGVHPSDRAEVDPTLLGEARDDLAVRLGDSPKSHPTKYQQGDRVWYEWPKDVVGAEDSNQQLAIEYCSKLKEAVNCVIANESSSLHIECDMPLALTMLDKWNIRAACACGKTKTITAKPKMQLDAESNHLNFDYEDKTTKCSRPTPEASWQCHTGVQAGDMVKGNTCPTDSTNSVAMLAEVGALADTNDRLVHTTNNQQWAEFSSLLEDNPRCASEPFITDSEDIPAIYHAITTPEVQSCGASLAHSSFQDGQQVRTCVMHMNDALHQLIRTTSASVPADINNFGSAHGAAQNCIKLGIDNLSEENGKYCLHYEVEALLKYSKNLIAEIQCGGDGLGGSNSSSKTNSTEVVSTSSSKTNSTDTVGNDLLTRLSRAPGLAVLAGMAAAVGALKAGKSVCSRFSCLCPRWSEGNAEHRPAYALLA